MLSSYIASRKVAYTTFVLLIIISPFFFIGGPTPASTPLFRTLWDCGHLLFFAGLVIVLKTRMNISGWRPCVVISAVVFVVGGAIEVIQAHTGRDGNWQDLLHDLVGTWLGLFWLQRSNLWVWLCRLATIVLILPNMWLVFLAGLMQWQSAQNFPLLAGFENSTDVNHWHGKVEVSSEQHTQGINSLKIYFDSKKYSGATLKDYLGDWRGYHTFSLDIYNPQEQALNLVLRINDLNHEFGPNAFSDRFNLNLVVEHGWNHIDIPLARVEHAPATRLMDMQNIVSVVIFAVQFNEPKIIYIDNLVLH
jgi:VanZ family protein